VTGVAHHPPAWASPETLEHVRPAVRDVLLASEAYRRLPADQQQALASEMVKVASYLTDPEGLVTEAHRAQPGEDRPLAEAQAQDATETARMHAAQDPGFAGEDFQGGAMRQGVEQFGALVKKVDFPLFVSGLIQGVFQAIVDSSIQQMHAYGELVANVAKTVDQFAQDNITMNNSRDWLQSKFPDKLGVDTTGLSGDLAADGETPAAAPRLVVTAEDQQAALLEISRELQLAKPVSDLSDEAEEARLVTHARLEMARSRQQLLASMVILGINRIVVTDGLINAKVLFDLRASDQAKRVSKASMHDTSETKAATQTSAGYGAWFSPVSASASASASTDHVATVESSVEDTSESKAEVKAKLSGEVRVNFKSDYFPMEKMASPEMIAAIQGNSTPTAKPVPPAPAGVAAPATTPAPAPAR
jgi:hypothetical protein